MLGEHALDHPRVHEGPHLRRGREQQVADERRELAPQPFVDRRGEAPLAAARNGAADVPREQAPEDVFAGRAVDQVLERQGRRKIGERDVEEWAPALEAGRH